jgi:hypothetical protein
MGSPSAGTPDKGFHDRLNRMAERRAPIDAAKPKIEVLPDWRASVALPASLVAAVICGMIAVVVARFARFHLLGGSLAGDNPDMSMLMDAGIAIAFSFIVFMLLRFEGHALKGAQVVGVFLMLGIMQNVVHSAPWAFNLLFSEEWTTEVTTASEPNSLYFRGTFFALSPAEEESEEELEAPVLPKVRRLG